MIHNPIRYEYTKKIQRKIDAGFTVIEATEEIIMRLDDLCQIMFDPENQPPQFNNKKAWNIFKKIQKV